MRACPPVPCVWRRIHAVPWWCAAAHNTTHWCAPSSACRPRLSRAQWHMQPGVSGARGGRWHTSGVPACGGAAGLRAYGAMAPSRRCVRVRTVCAHTNGAPPPHAGGMRRRHPAHTQHGRAHRPPVCQCPQYARPAWRATRHQPLHEVLRWCVAARIAGVRHVCVWRACHWQTGMVVPRGHVGWHMMASPQAVRPLARSCVWRAPARHMPAHTPAVCAHRTRPATHNGLRWRAGTLSVSAADILPSLAD